MAWSITNPFTALLSSDMPSGAQSQASIFATIGAWINALAGNMPVTAAGQVTITITTVNTPNSVNVTFPAGRFSTAPNVQVTSVNAAVPQNTQVSVTSVTSTGCTIYGNRSAGGTGTVIVNWLAVLSP